MARRTSALAILDLATDFSATATIFPESARRARPMPHNAIAPMTRASKEFAAARSNVRSLRASAASSSATLQAADDLGGQILNGFPGQVVHVRRRDTKHGPRSDADERAALEHLRRDGPGDPLGDQVVQRPSGGSRPLSGGSAQHVRLEANDGPIDVREGEGFAGRRRAQQRRERRGLRRRRRRLRLGAGCAAVQERKAQDEANPQPRSTDDSGIESHSAWR